MSDTYYQQRSDETKCHTPELTFLLVSCQQGEFISMGVYAGGNSYGIAEDLIYSFPVQIKVSLPILKRHRRTLMWTKSSLGLVLPDSSCEKIK